ncbi:MAG TPA: putative Fe-S cluster assembly protein SufT [Gammaproteobacteria bacterium]|nr:putative Fe-S cluster assembly protein SufT [Gammaproteobacteria bacterium]
MNAPELQQTIALKRDCDAILIPHGTPIQIAAGTEVMVTQALGGSVTVNIHGNLARIAGKDLDALGMEPQNAAPQVQDQSQQDGGVNEELLWEQLRTCYDPEIPINIVDLGLVYKCEVTPLTDGGGNRIDVRMTLTAPGCGMGQFLVEDVRAKLAQVPNVTEVNVDLVFDPPWHQGMMSEAARLQTGMY